MIKARSSFYAYVETWRFTAVFRRVSQFVVYYACQE